MVESTLEGIKTEWTCSAVEWVKGNHWLKFYGMQLQWKDGSLMLGQPGFAGGAARLCDRQIFSSAEG